MLHLSLFLGSLPEDVDDARLTEELNKWPKLERCFVMRNKDGGSKVSRCRMWLVRVNACV